MEAALGNNGLTNASDAAMTGTAASQLENSQEAMILSRKRKSPGVDSNTDAAAFGVASGQNGAAKKARLSVVDVSAADGSALPSEFWHHIFTFCPPRTLGNLLSVNKLFNSYLDPASPVVMEKPPSPLAKSTVKALEPNAIWRSARRSFWPNMPGPLKEKTELDMWRLSCSSTCQFCGKRDTRRQLPASDPFHVGPGADGVARIWEFRVRCCESCLSSKTLTEMDLILSAASTFLIPALPFVFVTSNSCVIPLNIIERGLLPPSSTLTKLFWSSDVENLRDEFASVRELGAPAVEEWQKGLSIRGSDHRVDSTKWEKYDDSGGVANMRTLIYPGFRPKPVAKPAPQATTVPPKADPPQQPAAILGDTAPALPAENNTWNHLVSRMMSHKAGAGEAVPPPPASNAPTPAQLAVVKEKTKEEIDAEWDEIQGPVRLKILKYADEAIIGDWDDGEKVTKDNAPSFAADVLLHVRKRFYMEADKDAKAACAAGREPVVDLPEGPFTQKLSLENMKYVFDVKVKPITGNLRKELFLCPTCDVNLKFFGFEGVIQHYAAKHTSILSVGNIVVHWRAEWPENPPFKANPRAPKNSSHPLPSLPSLPPKPPSHRAPTPASARPSLGFNQFPAGPPPAQPPPPMLIPPPPVSMPPFQQVQQQQQPFPVVENVGNDPHYTVPHYTAEPHQPPPLAAPSYPQTGTYALNPPNPPAFQQPAFQQPAFQQPAFQQPAFQQPTYQQRPQPAAYQPFVKNADQGGGAFTVHPNVPSQAFGAPAPVVVAQTFPPPATHDPSPSNQPTGGNGASMGEEAYIQPPPFIPYLVKLDETARHTGELWKDIGNMRHLPGVVKIFTLLYHTNRFFQSRFGELLPLSLFFEGLSGRKAMRPIRSINELPCKACYRGLGRMLGAQEERTLFSFPQLVTHFSSAHVGQRGEALSSNTPPLDWMTDMLLLPQSSALSDMVSTAQGKTFRLLSEAVDDFLGRSGVSQISSQLPRESNVPGDSRAPLYNGGSAAPIPPTAPASRANGQRNRKQGTALGTQSAPTKAVPETSMKRQRYANGKKVGQPRNQAGQEPTKKNSEPTGPQGQRKQHSDAEANQEQEERRQEQEIRAMWAADRAPKAPASNKPKTDTSASRHPKSAPVNSTVQRNETAHDAKPTRKGNEPQAKGKMAVSSTREPAATIKQEAQEDDQLATSRIPTHNAAAQDEDRPDLLGALEMHLSGAPENRPPAEREGLDTARGLARVVYVDERGRQVVLHRDSRFLPEDDDRYARYAVDGRAPGSRDPSRQYRERSLLPARHYADDATYAARSRGYEDAYDRGPPQTSPSYSYPRKPPRQERHHVYADEGGRGMQLSRPVEYEPYETYEVVRVIHPDGDYYARRPVRRELPPTNHRAAGRYYPLSVSSAPEPYDDAGERQMAGRDHAEDYPGPVYATAYEPYAAGSMQVHPGDEGSGRNGLERTAGPPPSAQQVMTRADPAYYEEYDPRRPSVGPGPGLRPGPAIGNAAAAAMQEERRRQVRYQ